VTIFGHDLLDLAGCLTFGKFRKKVIGRENQIATVQAGKDVDSPAWAMTLQE
jgi:hypothetical protein